MSGCSEIGSAAWIEAASRTAKSNIESVFIVIQSPNRIKCCWFWPPVWQVLQELPRRRILHDLPADFRQIISCRPFVIPVAKNSSCSTSKLEVQASNLKAFTIGELSMSDRKTNPPFLNGVPEMLILQTLLRRPMYGYELVQAIRVAAAKS